MTPFVEVRNLSKSYGQVRAVDDISFSIERGGCFGLLGPNGAGKTTTIEMMEGILRPDGGNIIYRGKPIGRHFKERVGIQFQHTALQEFITVRETLTLFASLYPRQRSFDELVDICALGEFLDRDNRKLSGGQRQRMLLAIALVNDPELVFLDEPTTGLDPQARRNFWRLIEKIKAENKTVLLTTHYMDEAEELCDVVAIMDHGKIIAQDSPAELLRTHFEGAIIRVPFDAGPGPILDSLPEGAKIVAGHLEVQTRRVDAEVRRLLERGVNLEGFSIHSADLDDLFLKLTGTSLRS